MPLSEQDKIKLAKNAFERFFDTVTKLLNEQRALFNKIMDQVAQRKITEHREKIKDIFNSKNNK